jgi:hypothetical protein
MPGEPRTSEAQLPKIDLQLQGAMPLDTRTTTQAIDRLKSGEGQRLQLTEPRFDSTFTSDVNNVLAWYRATACSVQNHQH